MGIDIYMKWRGQSKDQHAAQITGFEVSAEAGGVGYLREAYFRSGPSATEVLVPETWNQAAYESLGDRDEYGDEITGVPYKAATLRERLPAAIKAANVRFRANGGRGDDTSQTAALTAFVELAERLEQEGKQVYVYNSY